MRERFKYPLSVLAGAAGMYAVMFIGTIAPDYPQERPEELTLTDSPAGAVDPAEWRSWPRTGRIPQATDDCASDICLEHRERVLARELAREEEDPHAR